MGSATVLVPLGGGAGRPPDPLTLSRRVRALRCPMHVWFQHITVPPTHRQARLWAHRASRVPKLQGTPTILRPQPRLHQLVTQAVPRPAAPQTMPKANPLPPPAARSGGCGRRRRGCGRSLGLLRCSLCLLGRGSLLGRRRLLGRSLHTFQTALLRRQSAVKQLVCWAGFATGRL